MGIRFVCGSSVLPVEYNYVLAVLCGLDPIYPGGFIGPAEISAMLFVIEDFMNTGEIPHIVIPFPDVPRDPFMEFWAAFRSEIEEEYPIGDDVAECVEWLRKCEGRIINIVAAP
jgi:hypothetical protein